MITKSYNFLAVDLGATSGRTILGSVSEGKIKMEELTRFKHNIIHLSGHFYWDIYALYSEILRGLTTVADRGIELKSIGIDTWGVDFVFIGKDGQLLRTPYSYRDPHTENSMEHYFKLISKDEVYNISGIQFMNFNSLFQLYAIKEHQDPTLEIADKILFLPDALSYMLTGKMVTERTIMSTSSMMDAHTGKMNNKLLEPLGLTAEKFAPYVMPGDEVGCLTDEIQKITGLGKVPVVAVAEHDTASAVAAVPAEDDNFAYLSSGTWSLMGIETKEPIINKETFTKNFTNEGGIENTTRLLKNICGMWLLECCRKEWTNAPEKYEDLYREVKTTKEFRSFIFPDAPEFTNPSSMIEAIKNFCKYSGQPIPETYKEQARCIFDSLAMRYSQVFRMLSELSPFPLKRLHIIGGGTQNYLLNQYTANALGVPVYTGPIEATAIGNIMVQAQAAGLVKNLKEIRTVIRQSFPPKCYMPDDSKKWADAYEKYLKVVAISKM